MYAVAKIKGKQYRLEEGAIVFVDRMDAETGSTVAIEEVYLLAEADKVEVGTPVLAGVTISATVLGEEKDKKIRIAKFKPKHNEWHKVQGHRQRYTKLRIDKISK
jgi:large subunit ribosomal protein L21